MIEPGRAVLCSGQEVEIYDGESRKDLQQISEWSKFGFLKPINGNWILPKGYLACDKALYNFEHRPTDVYINGYPKTGTTWVQEIVWTILKNADLNHPLQTASAHLRVPWFEADSFRGINEGWFFGEFAKLYDTLEKPSITEMFAHIPNPRIYKSHASPSTINQNMVNVSKMVYVIRNPLDAFYSFYNFHRYFCPPFGLRTDLQGFTDNYIKGEVWCGNAAEHFLSWWPYRDHKNVHIIFYEKLKQNPAAEMKRLAQFLEVELTEKQIANVIHWTSFKSMKAASGESEQAMEEYYDLSKTEDQDSFFRKGEVGDSKNLPKDIYNKLAAYFQSTLGHLDLGYNFRPQ